MPLPLHTSRLELTKFTLNDTTFILKLLNSPGWLQFIGDRNIHDTEAAKQYLETGPIELYDSFEFGPYKVTLKETGQPIGMCGLFRRDYLDSPDLGFAFLDEFQRQGFAIEAAKAILAYECDTFNFKRVYATAMKENSRSQHLLKKLGFRFMNEAQVPGKEENVYLFVFKNDISTGD